METKCGDCTHEVTDRIISYPPFQLPKILTIPNNRYMGFDPSELDYIKNTINHTIYYLFKTFLNRVG